jgi:hypothetical protein
VGVVLLVGVVPETAGASGAVVSLVVVVDMDVVLVEASVWVAVIETSPSLIALRLAAPALQLPPVQAAVRVTGAEGVFVKEIVTLPSVDEQFPLTPV